MSYSLLSNSPSAGYISWSGVDIVYDGSTHAVANGNTNKKYCYWLLSQPGVLQTSNAYPSLTADDCIVFINNGGVGLSVLDASVVNGSMIVPGTIQGDAIMANAIAASHIAAHTIIGEHIAVGTLTGDLLAANTITADKIDGRNLEIKDASGNTIFGVSTNLDVSRVNGITSKIDASAARVLTLSNESHTLPASQTGVVSSFAGATSVIKVVGPNGTDETSYWTLSKGDSQVTSTLASGVITITAMPDASDSGYVDVTATRSGFTSLTKRFSISKAKSGTVGSDGIAYWMTRSASSIRRTSGNSLIPASVVFSAKYASGSASIGDYAGRWIVQTTTDASNYTTIYTSSVDESQITVSPTGSIIGIRIRLYKAGGTTVLIDEEVIPVVLDGVAGSDGTSYRINSSAPVIYKSSESSAIPAAHTSVSVRGQKSVGSTTSWYGWVTVTPNGGTEATTATDTASTAVTLAPANGDGKTSYTIRMYNQATVSGATLLDTQVVPVIFKGTSGASSVTAVLSNDAHVVPADSDGLVVSFSGATTTMSVYLGTTDDSANWTYAVTKSNLTCTEAATSRTQTVTALSADSGYLDIVASRSGYASVSKRFVVTKAKGGINGANTYSISIESSSGTRFVNGSGSTSVSPRIFYGPTEVTDLTGWTFNWYLRNRAGKRGGFVDASRTVTPGGRLISANTAGSGASFTFGGAQIIFSAGDLIKCVTASGVDKYYEVASYAGNTVTIRNPVTNSSWLNFTNFPQPVASEFVNGCMFVCTSSGIRTSTSSNPITVTGDDIDSQGNISCEANRP